VFSCAQRASETWSAANLSAEERERHAALVQERGRLRTWQDVIAVHGVLKVVQTETRLLQRQLQSVVDSCAAMEQLLSGCSVQVPLLLVLLFMTPLLLYVH
jgi:hypothetical protein